jgi:hypothetical protein
LVIYIENAGDFIASLTAVKAIHFCKVILNCDHLDLHLCTAIGHAQDAEDPHYILRSPDADL